MPIHAYAMWKVKKGKYLSKKDISYFGAGGYSFTNKDNIIISFDFEGFEADYSEKDQIFDANLYFLDNDFVTSSLEDLKNNIATNLIQKEYDINLFKNGFFEEKNNECYCTLDIDMEEVNPQDYLEPIYLEVYDSDNKDNNVIFINKLTKEEYKKYFYDFIKEE